MDGASELQASLFDEEEAPAARVRRLGQYMTPMWAGEALVDRYFSDLASGDVVLEPTCGDGSLLRAIPAHVQAFGVEIDPVLAARARRTSGRPVITGDIRNVQLDLMPTAILSNPPFEMAVVDEILERAHRWLPRDGRAGFVLPAYALQTPARVMRYSERWSLQADLLPRTLFPGLQCPLVFALFRKDLRQAMVGFALFRETASVEQMSAHARAELARNPATWRAVVDGALRELGGRGTLAQIYAAVDGRRPSTSTWWKEKVRQILQSFYVRVGPGEYTLGGAG